MQLHDICLAQGLPIYRPVGDAIEVMATGAYPTSSHWFTLSQKPNGTVGVVIEFPPCEREVANVEELCRMVTEVIFGNEARVYFDASAKHFFVGGFVAEQKVGSYLVEMARVCDNLIPMCAAVGRQGWWNESSISLAFMPKESFGLA